MRSALLAAAVPAAFLAVPASAAVSFTAVGADLLAGAKTITFQNTNFTFSATRDLFNPLAVQVASPGAVSAFGGFLGIALTPSPSFTNRGVVAYGPAFGQFAAFTNTTTVNYSNGDNFLGLRVTVGTDNYYGFAYTTNSVLNGYGLESTPNTAITATTAVPEPATWALTILGFGAIGAAMRGRRGLRARAA